MKNLIFLMLFLPSILPLKIYSQDLPFDSEQIIDEIRHNRSLQSINNQIGLFKDNLLNSEFLLDTNIVYWTSPGGRYYSDFAFDGNNYLLVWTDLRNEYPYLGDIYAARINNNGELLDVGGIEVCRHERYQEEPAVAFDGTNFLVVWEDDRDNQDDIYGARIDQNGVVLDPGGFPISTTQYKEYYPDITFDGTNYTVVWADESPGSGSYTQITAARINTLGEIVDPSGYAVTNTSTYKSNPAITFNGTNYLVVWDEDINNQVDVYGARLTTDGVSLDPAGILISAAANSQYKPQLCFGITNFIVVWGDGRSGVTAEIFGTRVSQAGDVLDPNGILIATSTSDSANIHPSVAFDGTNFFTFWDRGNYGDLIQGIPPEWDIFGARINQAGTVLDPDAILIVQSPAEGTSQEVNAVFNGTEYAIIWREATGIDNVLFSTVSASGVISNPDGINASVAPNSQKWPAIAFDGTNHLAVWCDYRGASGYEIYGTRIGPDGSILDPDGIAIASTDGWSTEIPDVAYNGTNYLAVWHAGYGTYAIRVSPAGIVLDPQPIIIREGNNNETWTARPKVTSDGNNWLVLYMKGTLEVDIYGSRVSSDGIVLDSVGFAICTAMEEQRDPVGSFDGQNYMIVWEDVREGFPDVGIFGARVTPSATVLDPDGFTISPGDGSKSNPSVAFDGTNYFVVWSDDDIYGRRISVNGTLIDQSDRPISTATGDQYPVQVEFDGTNYLAVWQDDRNGPSADIYGAFIGTNGNVIVEMPVSRHPYSQLDPALSIGNGEVLVAYSRHTDEINGVPINTQRIWGIFSDDINAIEESEVLHPNSYSLYQNYPNPFNPSTKIKFTISVFGFASLKVYDVLGNEVATLIHENKPGGEYEVNFNSEGLTSGVYFYQLKAGSYIETKKMLLLR